MKKKICSPVNTSIWQKMALFFLGLVLSLVLLEAGMRLGGFILSSIQEYGNLQSIRQKGAYRILCLGGSTTERQYPKPLEQILNQRDIGVRFSVIDKGRSSTNTCAILTHVGAYLAEYRPDMVIAMMGINDRGLHIPYEAPTTSGGMLFIRSLRTYKLARYLTMHILSKARESGCLKPYNDKHNSPIVEVRASGSMDENTLNSPVLVRGPLAENIEITFKNNINDFQQAQHFLMRGELSRAEFYFKKAIEVHPKSDNAYVELGRLYLSQGKLSQGEGMLKKAVELNKANDLACVELGGFYRDQGKFSEAEILLKRAVEVNPNNANAYVGLGRLYQEENKVSLSEESYKKAVDLNPQSNEVYVWMGLLCRDQGHFLQAEEFFKKAIALCPRDINAYFELGIFYRNQGRLSQAENVFKQAVEIDPQNDRLLRALASLYAELGKPVLAREYSGKVTSLQVRAYSAVTVSNYRRLKNILDQKGITLVCVQYPMRDVEPLKKIFETDQGIIFVDNEKVFKEAVKRKGYKEYFRDMFAGDFGHCGEKGNELLAQNIATVILKEVFNK